MSDKKTRHVIDDLRGGRNAYDPAWAIRDNECADAVNVDWYRSRFANKRGGMTTPSTSGTTRTGGPAALFRHVPGTDEPAAELWVVDGAVPPVVERLAGGTAWSVPSLADAPTGFGWDFTAATINGKLFLAYKSGQNRLHCWDGSTVRRAGLATPTLGSTITDHAAGGAYPAIPRYYGIRWTTQSAGITILRSERSHIGQFTPSGVSDSVDIGRPPLAGESETHWEIEASVDDATYYRIATVAAGTTTYQDFTDVTTYNLFPNLFPLSAVTGKHTLQKSYKFIAADQNRMLGYGSWTATDKQARVEVSAVIGSLDVGDAERIDTTTNAYIDFDESDSGVATGLAGPIFGSYFAFKERQVWQLTATGLTSLPYRQEAISKSIGALHHYAIVRGEDESGNPALYWMSHRGPYRWSINGLEYIGRNMEDCVLGPTATINLGAGIVARSLYYPDKRQVWFWIATGSSDVPNMLHIFDVQTNGWSRVPLGDQLAGAISAVMFANTLGASMSRDLKPYVGTTAFVAVLKADTGTDDLGTPFKAYVVTKAVEPGGPGYAGKVGDSIIVAKAATGVTIADTVTADFGMQSTPGTADLTPQGSETRVTRRIEGSALAGDVKFIQHQIGDAAAVSNAWTLDRIIIPVEKLEAVSS